ncbi:MAG: Rieske (2Fe-2S) protein [Luminiphilus sp.]|nr:Rieske (2Fe-2S) protein [Luminiphilus sp.]
MRFLALDKLINVQDGYRQRFKIDSLDLVLVREAGEISAFAALCPHQEQSLEYGQIESGVIYCPRHGFAFSLTSGEHLSGQCARLAIYTVHYEGNEVGILLEG